MKGKAKVKRKKAEGRAELARLGAAAKGATPRQVARATELLAMIARRIQRIEEDFFDIGAALKELKDKKLFVALGHATFDAMLGERVALGRSQVYKLIAIVERVTRQQALDLGAERAYAIARLVATTPEPDTVTSVLETGVRVGKKRHAARTMSRRELDAARRTIAARTKKPDTGERDAKKAARGAQARLRSRRIDAKIAIAKEQGHWWAIVRIPIDDLSSLVAER